MNTQQHIGAAERLGAACRTLNPRLTAAQSGAMLRQSVAEVLLVELRDGQQASDEALLAPLRGRVVPWWIPDAVIRLGAMPVAATGKVENCACDRNMKDSMRDWRRDGMNRVRGGTQ